MVRHGERVDETKHGAVWRAKNKKRWFDPPLTERGHQQATNAAIKIVKHFGRADNIPFECVYASPLVRTMQTASQIALHLDLPIKPDPGIATCTAAYKHGGSEGQPLLEHSQIREHVKADVDDFDHQYNDEFIQTIERLSHLQFRKNPDKLEHEILVVTHREGLRDTSAVAGSHFTKTPYCGVGIFEYRIEIDPESKQPLKSGRWSLLATPTLFDEQLNLVLQ